MPKPPRPMAPRPRIQRDSDYLKRPSDSTGLIARESGTARVAPDLPKMAIRRGAYVCYLGHDERYHGRIARVFWITAGNALTPALLYLQFKTSRYDWVISALDSEVRAVIDCPPELDVLTDTVPWPPGR